MVSEDALEAMPSEMQARQEAELMLQNLPESIQQARSPRVPGGPRLEAIRPVLSRSVSADVWPVTARSVCGSDSRLEHHRLAEQTQGRRCQISSSVYLAM